MATGLAQRARATARRHGGAWRPVTSRRYLRAIRPGNASPMVPLAAPVSAWGWSHERRRRSCARRRRRRTGPGARTQLARPLARPGVHRASAPCPTRCRSALAIGFERWSFRGQSKITASLQVQPRASHAMRSRWRSSPSGPRTTKGEPASRGEVGVGVTASMPRGCPAAVRGRNLGPARTYQGAPQGTGCGPQDARPGGQDGASASRNRRSLCAEGDVPASVPKVPRRPRVARGEREPLGKVAATQGPNRRVAATTQAPS